MIRLSIDYLQIIHILTIYKPIESTTNQCRYLWVLSKFGNFTRQQEEPEETEASRTVPHSTVEYYITIRVYIYIYLYTYDYVYIDDIYI